MCRATVLLALCARGAAGSCQQRARSGNCLAESAGAGDLADASLMLQRRAKMLTGTRLVANDSVSAPEAVKPLDVRPSVGGQPTAVGFGLLAKNFYGADFKAGTVTADLVLTLRWADNRTTALVPQGLDALTLSQERAAKLMWMPNVFLTNQDLDGTQVTSTSVAVGSGGAVEKVQRFLARVKFASDIRAFPFDSQSFRFRVASTSLMADELRLRPLADEGISGVVDGIFDGGEFDLVSAGTRDFEERDGSLEKSRGELEIRVRRVSEPYLKSLLIPALLLVSIAYTAFLFPLTVPFIMPRVATSMITFLSLLVLSGRISDMLPRRGSASWIDVFEQTCMMMMFTTLGLNILLEVVEHSLKRCDNARKMQRELQCLMPIVEVVVVSICFLRHDGAHLWWLDFWTKLVWLGFLALYLGWWAKVIAVSRGEVQAAEPK